MFEEKKGLRIPGPTPVPPRVLRATSRPMINHRGGDFHELYNRVMPGLKKIFKTDGDIIALTGSGTSGMEAAVANTVSPGDTVLCLVGGKFGERWALMCEAFGASVVQLDYEWGAAVDPEAVRQALEDNPKISVIFATQNESSTAVRNDIEAIGKARDRAGSNALLVVDTVSSLGGMDFRMDEWGVDIAITGSQKCLMLPPGLAFVAVGSRAWPHIEKTKSSRFYVDLRTYRKFAGIGETPYTPNVSLFFGLEESLQMIEAEGLDHMFERHLLMRDMVRAAAKALGLELYVKDEKAASPTVTAVKGVANGTQFDVEAFRKIVNQRYGVVLSGGQGELKGHIFRIGHMGYSTPLDMISTIGAVELGLKATGIDVTLGAGVAAAEEVLLG